MHTSAPSRIHAAGTEHLIQRSLERGDIQGGAQGWTRGTRNSCGIPFSTDFTMKMLLALSSLAIISTAFAYVNVNVPGKQRCLCKLFADPSSFERA